MEDRRSGAQEGRSGVRETDKRRSYSKEKIQGRTMVKVWETEGVVTSGKS